jgi:hypothetical protein
MAKPAQKPLRQRLFRSDFFFLAQSIHAASTVNASELSVMKSTSGRDFSPLKDFTCSKLPTSSGAALADGPFSVTSSIQDKTAQPSISRSQMRWMAS